MQFLGIDLAWADNPGSLANETGLVLLAGDGTVVDAGWSRGIQETLGCLDRGSLAPGLSGTGIRSGAVRSWGNDVAMGMAVPERPRSSPRPSRLKGCRTRLLDARTRCRRPVIRTPNDSNTVLKPRLDDMRGTP